MASLDLLTEDIILNILYYLDNNIKYIFNLRTNLPKHKNRINDSIIVLTADNPTYADLRHLNNCNNLIIVSYDILARVSKQEYFSVIKRMESLKQLNFHIGSFDNVTDSLDYLNSFLKYVPKSNFKDKTFRLIFEMKYKDLNRNFAYIFDRGYFSVANLNQIRNYHSEDYEKMLLHFELVCEGLIKKYFNCRDLFYMLYEFDGFKYYKNNEISNFDLSNYDEVDEIVKDSFIILMKNETNREIYYSNDFLKNLTKGFKLKNVEVSYVTASVVGSLLLLYCTKHSSIFKYTKKDDIYIGIWDIPAFETSFGVNKQFFQKIYENDKNSSLAKKVAKQFIDNKVDIKYIVDYIISNLNPIDIIPKADLSKLCLPMKKTFMKLED